MLKLGLRNSWGFWALLMGMALSILGVHSPLAEGAKIKPCPFDLALIADDEYDPIARPQRSTRAWVVLPETKLAEYGALYAVADVHGEYQKLVTLLKNSGIIDTELHWSAGNSLLLVVGDLIAKGDRSAEVVLLIKQLISEAEAAGGRVIVTMGNHEARLLANPEEGPEAFEASFERSGVGRSRRPEVIEFLRSLPLGAFVGDILFTHTGYISRKTFRTGPQALREDDYEGKGLAGKHSILEMKLWQQDEEREARVRLAAHDLHLRAIVFGHQTLALGRRGIVQSDDGAWIQIDPDWLTTSGGMLKASSALAFSQNGVSATVRVTSLGQERPLFADERP